MSILYFVSKNKKHIVLINSKIKYIIFLLIGIISYDIIIQIHIRDAYVVEVLIETKDFLVI